MADSSSTQFVLSGSHTGFLTKLFRYDPRKARLVRVALFATAVASVALAIIVLAVRGGGSGGGGGGKVVCSSSKEQSCATFVELAHGECLDESMWAGRLVDLFSPDDTACAFSYRYIDLGGKGELQVSANGTGADCSSSWGRKFNASSTVNPVLSPPLVPGACNRTVSFLSKLSPSDAAYPLALDGALNFTLTLGKACGNRTVLRWNGVYDGRGGEFPPGQQAPASPCDNFWAYLT